MIVKLRRKYGHKFFEFVDDGVSRTICVDGWINPKICPSFCTPYFSPGWERLPDDKCLRITETSDTYTVVCPTCFGYISRRGTYIKSGDFHTELLLDRSGLSQYLYNYN